MFNRRLTPQSLLMLMSLAAVMFVGTAHAQETEIQKYARFQKDLTNPYEREAELTFVWVGWDKDEAFEVYKTLPTTTVKHVFMDALVGAAKKSVVVGKKGIRDSDVTTKHAEILKNILEPKPKPVANTFGFDYPVRDFIVDALCPPGRT